MILEVGLAGGLLVAVAAGLAFIGLVVRRGAAVLRLPMIYDPHHWQRREEPVLRRLRAHRRHLPIGAATQHLLVSVARAQTLLGWTPGDPTTRVAESVRWHLAHPPTAITWTEADTTADDAALTHTL